MKVKLNKIDDDSIILVVNGRDVIIHKSQIFDYLLDNPILHLNTIFYKQLEEDFTNQQLSNILGDDRSLYNVRSKMFPWYKNVTSSISENYFDVVMRVNPLEFIQKFEQNL